MPDIFKQRSSESVMLALGLTVFAGLATGIGSGIAFWARRNNVRLLAWALGGVGAALMLGWLLPTWAMGIVFAGLAGAMVYISLDELLPTAWRFGTSRKVIAGITAGMAIMAGSLLLLSTGDAQP